MKINVNAIPKVDEVDGKMISCAIELLNNATYSEIKNFESFCKITLHKYSGLHICYRVAMELAKELIKLGVLSHNGEKYIINKENNNEAT